MIYLFNNGGPGSVGGGAGSTDILISWIYKLTTGTSPQYSMASAITLIISVIVICVSLLVFKRQMRSIWGLTMKNFIRVLDSKTTFSLFTYFFFLILSVIIIYPLLITASTAFKSGNIAAFSLDLSSDWTLGNFTRLFSETLYGTWYKNTLIISVLTMIVQVTVVTLAGYTYSRYRFIGRKSSLMFFLVIQMVPTMAALTALCHGFLIRSAR